MNPGTLSEEERYLSAHIADMQRLAVKSGVPRFSMFLLSLIHISEPTRD